MCDCYDSPDRVGPWCRERSPFAPGRECMLQDGHTGPHDWEPAVPPATTTEGGGKE